MKEQQPVLDIKLKATKKQFHMFQGLQRSGQCNMLDPYVRDFCDINSDQHIDICQNYDTYVEVYNVK